MHVFVVIRSAFSEHTHMVNVMGVFAHMHQATRYVAESKEQDSINRKVQSAYTIEKHAVMDPGRESIPGTGWLPGGEGVQTDPSQIGARSS